MENKQMKCIKGESYLHCGSNYCRFVDELDQLKTENEELKINNAQFIKDNEFLAKRNSKLKVENDLYKNAHRTEQDRRRSYENALAEIKEIAEKISLPMGTGKSGNRVILAKQILQKISEVE